MKSRPRNVRHRELPTLRHSSQFLEWLQNQATRLEVTADYVFEELLVGQGMNFELVENMQPPEPEPEPEGP